MIGILDRVTRSLERPSVPLSSGADELYEAFGAGRTNAGVTVNRATALRHPALWRGVNLISRDVGKLPLVVYQRDGGGKIRATSHAAHRLLDRKPNPWMTPSIFKQTLTAHALLQGGGFAFINRREDATPVELLPLLPDRTYPIRENGQLIYVTAIGGTMEDPTSTIRRLLPENVLHIKGLGYDGLTGYSLIDLGADTIGHGMAMERFSSRYFRNSARPSVVIEHPGSMSESAAKRLRESWDQLYAGVDNAHRTAILEEGMKVHALTINARDSQLDESQKFDLTKIANLLGLPPHKVGGDGRTSYNSLEQENQAYLDEGLDPWLVAWEEECWAKLLTEKEKQNDTHIVEFMRQALVRADMAARSAYYHNALLDGYMNRDEVRSLENLNPMPDEEGKKYFIPLNVTTTGDDDEASEVDDLQATALNGAQVTSMVQIVEQVAAGTIPKKSAKAMIKASFPLVTDAEVNAIIDPIEEKPILIPSPTTDPAAPPVTTPDPDEEAARAALLTDAICRATRVIGVWARRAAKDSKCFADWLEHAEEKNRESVLEILDAPCRICRCKPEEVSEAIFMETIRALDECYSTKTESVFASSVDEVMSDRETDHPATLAGQFLNKGV